MKVTRLLTLLVLLAGLFASPTPAQAAPALAPFGDDTVIFGQDFTLASGQVIDGTLLAFGSNVHIEEGALIEQDLVAFGSEVELDGEVGRDAIVVGSSLSLGSTAVIGRDLIAPGSDWNRNSQAEIGRDVISETGPFQMDLDEIFGPDGLNLRDGINLNPPLPPRFDNGWSYGFNPITDAVWLLFRSLGVATLALLVVIFLPLHTRRVLNTVREQPGPSIGVGFLGSILTPIVALLMVVTICLVPFVVVLAMLVAAAMLFGWIALGLETGRRLEEAFHGEWTEAVQAWVGTFVFSLVVGVIAWVPCIGWLASLVLGLLGFGAVLLTRFGTQDYPLAEVAIVEAPPAAPAKKASPRKASPKKNE